MAEEKKGKRKSKLTSFFENKKNKKANKSDASEKIVQTIFIAKETEAMKQHMNELLKEVEKKAYYNFARD